MLEKLEELQEVHHNDRPVAICTDSKTTLDLLQNKFKRNRLTEFIIKKLIELTHLKWIMHFGWVKGHSGRWWIGWQKQQQWKNDQFFMTKFQERRL